MPFDKFKFQQPAEIVEHQWKILFLGKHWVSLIQGLHGFSEFLWIDDSLWSMTLRYSICQIYPHLPQNNFLDYIDSHVMVILCRSILTHFVLVNVFPLCFWRRKWLSLLRRIYFLRFIGYRLLNLTLRRRAGAFRIPYRKLHRWKWIWAYLPFGGDRSHLLAKILVLGERC